MGIGQKITSSILFNSIVKQYVNSFENKQLIIHLLDGEFDRIESLLNEGNIEKARNEIDIILLKKERLPEELEERLIFLKGSIELELENYIGVESIIKELEEKQHGSKYSLDLKYEYSIKTNNEKLMKICIKEFKNIGEEYTRRLQKEILFYFQNSDFNKIIEYAKDINEVDIKDKTIFHYISVAYLNLRNYNEAKKFSDKSIELGAGELAEYVNTLAEVSPIIERRGSIITLSSKEEDILKGKVQVLRSLINKLPKEIELEVNLTILSILLIIDLNGAKEYYNKNADVLYKSLEGRYIKGNIEELNSNFDEAKKIYLELLNEIWSEELLIHTMSCMYCSSDYYSAIDLFEKYIDKIEDKDFILAESYLISIKNIAGTDKMKSKLYNLKERYKDSIRFNIFLANINENIEQRYRKLKDIEELLNDSNELDRELLKNSYFDIEKFDDAIRVIRPILKYKDVLIGTIKMVISKGLNEFYLELIDEIDKYNDVVLMKYKKDMLYGIKEFNEVKNVVQKIYLKESTIENLRELIDIKLDIEDTSELEKLFLKLIPSSEPMDYMRVACGYFILNNIKKYYLYSYEAVFMTKGILDIRLYKLLVGMNFKLAYMQKVCVREIDKVIEDVVVVLKDNTNIIKICLNGEDKYQINKELFNCLHIIKDSSLWIDLIEQKVGDKVSINGEEYLIDSIIDKNIIVHQYCFNELDRTKNNICKPISIDKFPDYIKELSKSDEGRYELKLNMYNFKENSIGLPFSKVFYGEDLKKSIEILNIILFNDKYSFYISATEEDIYDDKIVLSYQTFLILEHYNMLDIILVNPKKYYAVNSLKKLILNTIIETKGKSKQLYIGYNFHSDNLYRNEKDYDVELRKLRNIFNVLDKINCNDIEYKVRDSLVNVSRSFINDVDIDIIYLAKELNSILIIDDLFIRNLINSNPETNNVKSMNIRYFLNILRKTDIVRYLDTVKQMVSDKVKYVLNKDDFKYIILNYKISGYNIKWFEELINEMTCESDEYYRQIILMGCNELNRSENYKVIIEELLMIVSKLNLI